MPNIASPDVTQTAGTTPATMVSNAELERFLGNCGEDTRRKILRHLGLPKRKKRPWTEIWNAVGLDTEQPQALWEELTLGSGDLNQLWDATRVAEETGLAPSTVNGYCHRNVFRNDFPKPLINLGRKTRLWLPLEVRAYIAPAIYGERAAMLRRRPRRAAASGKDAPVPYTGTMQPLPPKASDAG